MPYIPPQVAKSDLSELLNKHLERLHQGKVRDSYDVGEHIGDEMMLVVATDRISAFDFVLGSTIPDKGAVLTAMTVLWLEVLLTVENHVAAYGPGIDNYLPKALRGNRELWKRGLIVQKLNMIRAEYIYRAYLTGSGLKDYQNNGGVLCGYELPEGLHDGSKLPQELFTPSTKAEKGHDENIDAESVITAHGKDAADLGMSVFCAGCDTAETRGIILADTKFEFGRDPEGTLVLGDEVLTPDSSRFWLKTDWEEAQKQSKAPAGYDKQPVRDALKTVVTPFFTDRGKQIIGVNNLSPEDEKHQQWVGEYLLPEEAVASTTERYRKILEMLYGDGNLEAFQANIMGIN